jgi:putative membrane protein
LKYLELFFKGILIGIGKIIPGVSGSLIAISLGVYEDAIKRITYFFKDFYENIYYFIILMSGLMISIIFGSKVILFLLDNCYSLTIFLFLGLLSGTIPTLRSKIKNKDKNYFVSIIIFIILFNLGLFLKSNNTFVYENNILSNLQVCLIGILEAFTMIIPGISGTSLFISLGYYEFIMKLFSNVFIIVKEDIQIILLFFIFLIIGIYLASILMNYLLKNHVKMTYTMILAFCYSTLFFILKDILSKETNIINYIIGICLFFLGFYVSKKIE